MGDEHCSVLPSETKEAEKLLTVVEEYDDKPLLLLLIGSA